VKSVVECRKRSHPPQHPSPPLSPSVAVPPSAAVWSMPLCRVLCRFVLNKLLSQKKNATQHDNTERGPPVRSAEGPERRGQRGGRRARARALERARRTHTPGGASGRGAGRGAPGARGARGTVTARCTARRRSLTTSLGSLRHSDRAERARDEARGRERSHVAETRERRAPRRAREAGGEASAVRTIRAPAGHDHELYIHHNFLHVTHARATRTTHKRR
jgi:hypothetical protein